MQKVRTSSCLAHAAAARMLVLPCVVARTCARHGGDIADAVHAPWTMHMPAHAGCACATPEAKKLPEAIERSLEVA